MLTKVESGTIFNFINSILLPFQVGKVNGRLVQLSGRKWIVWVVLFSIVFTHVSSTFFQFIFSCLAPSSAPAVPPHIFSMRLDLAYLPTTYIFLILVLEVSNEDAVRHLFYNFYHDRKGSPDNGRRKLWELSVEEFLPLYITFLVRVIGIFLIPAVFLTEPQVSMLYSYLAQYTRWFGSLVVAVAVEMLAAVFWLTNAGFLTILHCLGCSKVRSEIGGAGKLLR